MNDSSTVGNPVVDTGSHVRALVVDDDENLLKIVSRELCGKGYLCTTRNNGKAALSVLAEEDFDVALIDLEMPEIDGFQMLTILRQEYPSIVPIILTGRGDIPRAVRAMSMGALDFLEKPCNPHLLENSIGRAIELRRLRCHVQKMEDEAVETRSVLERERASSQAQKLESVGRLAAGVAHEINTPTQYVGDNIEFLQIAYESLSPLLDMLRRFASDSSVPPALLTEIRRAIEESNLDYLIGQVPRAIEQSREGVERISSIVKAMKEFSHPGTEEKTASDLNQCVRSTIVVSRNEWKYVADLESDLDGDLPFVHCLPGDLNQVFLNLVVNAAHAIAEKTGNGAEGKGVIRLSTRRDGDWVEVQVSDTGAGIPEAIRERIFEPFFTTKKMGCGTGQGLAIARNVVVNKHGGTIAVVSEAGKGTTFTIRLPIGSCEPTVGSND